MKKLFLVFALLFASTVPSYALLTDDLVGYYSFDDSSSVDDTGNNDGTDSNISYTNAAPTVISYYSAFTRTSSSYISLGQPTNLDIVGDKTICAWVNATLSTNGYEGAIVSNYSSGGNSAQYQLKVLRNSSTDLRLVYNINVLGSQYTLTGDTDTKVGYGVWTHVCAVYDAGTYVVTFYVDGVNTYSASIGTGSPSPSAGVTAIGRAGSYNGIYFDGKLDEVGIWRRELTSDEVTELYNGGAGFGYPFSSGGGGGGSYTLTGTSSQVVPASLYSSQFFTSPVSTTTYSFTSTESTQDGTESGIVYIVHLASTSPSVSWGGKAMTLMETSATSSSYRLSLYRVLNPTTTSSVVVSSITASSTLYIWQGVYRNATQMSTDAYTIVSTSNKASLPLSNFVAPVYMNAAMFTISSLDDFDILPSSRSILTATSSYGNIAITRSTCMEVLDFCNVGYSKPFMLSDTRSGVLVGFSLYGTTTVTASSTNLVSDYLGGLGSAEAFEACLSAGFLGSISCLFQNLVGWFFGLFVPNSETVTEIRDMIISSTNSTSSVASLLFLVPAQFILWTSSSSPPTYTELQFYVPQVGGGGISRGISGQSLTATEKSLDYNLYQALQWLLGILTVFWVGKKFIRLLH